VSAPVYLDHNATTPIDESVLEAMLPFLRRQHGNASSRHEMGTVARRAVDRAREQVAAAVGARPSQVVFTSGGTEANNLFIKGAAAMLQPQQIVVSAIDHPCVAMPARDLVRAGWTLHRLAVDAAGVADLDDLDAALRLPTGIVSTMLANNETGVLQPVAAIAARARQARAWMHSDAVQALGKVPVDLFRHRERPGDRRFRRLVRPCSCASGSLRGPLHGPARRTGCAAPGRRCDGVRTFGTAGAEHDLFRDRWHRRRDAGDRARPARFLRGQRIGLLEQEYRTVRDAAGDGRIPGSCARRGTGQPRTG